MCSIENYTDKTTFTPFGYHSVIPTVPSMRPANHVWRNKFIFCSWKTSLQNSNFLPLLGMQKKYYFILMLRTVMFLHQLYSHYYARYTMKSQVHDSTRISNGYIMQQCMTCVSVLYFCITKL